MYGRALRALRRSASRCAPRSGSPSPSMGDAHHGAQTLAADAVLP
ncbi:hypothetical protein A7982_13259 [Minicystis rosea]|nr:hypothetical protein A7982_13259 [Minicystis rosea]